MSRVSSHAWCILRCSGAHTLRLADSLTAAGIEAWTPAEEAVSRTGRNRSRINDTVPVLPTYVFARAARLLDLIGLSQAFISPHPDFSVFKPFGLYPLIANAELDPLRVAERKGQSVENLMRFSPGDIVRCAEAGFQGLSGVVETSKGKFTLVAFPGLQVSIATMLLLPEDGSFSKAA